MEVVHRQQFILPGAQPLLPRVGLTLRAVAISARVERDGGSMQAIQTSVAMATERGGAAALDCPEHFELSPSQ
jgi:hypothetical protein